MTKIKRSLWVILGRKVGTATGWEQYDNFSIGLLGFIPGEGCKFPTGNITIEFEKGTFEIYDVDGRLVTGGDLIDAVKDCAKAE